MKEYQGWAEWADKYKPIRNRISEAGEMFETYGAELDYVKAVDPKYVWTRVSGDMSDLIVAGYAYVNIFGDYVTELPWENETDTVLLSVEKECECFSEDEAVMQERGTQDLGDPDCAMCEGYGLITEYVG